MTRPVSCQNVLVMVWRLCLNLYNQIPACQLTRAPRIASKGIAPVGTVEQKRLLQFEATFLHFFLFLQPFLKVAVRAVPTGNEPAERKWSRSPSLSEHNMVLRFIYLSDFIVSVLVCQAIFD